MTRTIIRGGTVVRPNGIQQADIIVDGERIAAIEPEAQTTPADTVIDADGLLVLPGVIDAHTHIQLDTGVYKTADDWAIGARAAAAGGVTTVIDFATQFPGQTADEALDARLAEAAPAIIDYGLHCMITDLPEGGEDTLLGRLIERGVMSFKVYTTYRPNYFMDDATLARLMPATARVGGMVMVHAENDAIVTEATEALVAAGKTSWAYHGQGRPLEAELEAAARVARLAREGGAPLYIVHCTHAETIRRIEDARAESDSPLFCETCPQYLLLSADHYSGDHPEHYILQPPLRAFNADQRSTLWEKLEAGSINVLSTDTCDYTLAQKTEFHEFTKTPGGLPGVETLLSLIYTYAVADDRVDFGLTDMTLRLSEMPARIFGRYPQKGALLPGSDADIVLYDPAPQRTIHHTDLHYLAGYSPYEGMPVQGRVVATLSRGEVIYRDGQFLAEAGRGRFVPGAPFDINRVHTS